MYLPISDVIPPKYVTC